MEKALFDLDQYHQVGKDFKSWGIGRTALGEIILGKVLLFEINIKKKQGLKN